MSFRKRNIAISPSGPRALSSPPSPTPNNPTASYSSLDANPIPNAKSVPGVRPSPIDGRPTTSTGTPSLDALLAGHAGLALGSSILLAESGTTDFAGALLRYYAAEGVVQGHLVHVVGFGEQWGRDLPGLTGAADAASTGEGNGTKEKSRMKIAWRYERLGEFGAGVAGSRGGSDTFLQYDICLGFMIILLKLINAAMCLKLHLWKSRKADCISDTSCCARPKSQS